MPRLILLFGVLAGFSLVAAPNSRADADDAVGDLFVKEFAAIARQSGQTGIPVACTIAPPKGENADLLADRRVRDRLKWFLPQTVPPAAKLAKALNAESPTVVVILNAQGKVLARGGPKDSAEDFVRQLKEIGKTSRAEFLAKLSAEDTTAADCKNAVSGLVRMGGTAAELVPLLRHKSAEVKAAITKALPTLPPDEVALAAFDGLASDDVEMRTVCYRWATTTAKVPKTPALKFWRDEDGEKRKTALTEWREAAMVDMGALNKDIIEFCEANLGKKVGGGECSHLAEEAFKIVNAKPIQFSGKTYIWGREVTSKQKVLPGDVVQLEDCKFKNSGAPHHTQVIRSVLGPNRYEVLEQNVNGRRTVGPGILDLNLLLEGTVKIFRPVPK
jgi:hypothetical protein